MRELEVGLRVAATEESEAAGFDPLFDLFIQERIKLSLTCSGCLGDVGTLGCICHKEDVVSQKGEFS